MWNNFAARRQDIHGGIAVYQPYTAAWMYVCLQHAMKLCERSATSRTAARARSVLHPATGMQHRINASTGVTTPGFAGTMHVCTGARMCVCTKELIDACPPVYVCPCASTCAHTHVSTHPRAGHNCATTQRCATNGRKRCADMCFDICGHAFQFL